MSGVYLHIASIRFLHEYVGEGLYEGIKLSWGAKEEAKMKSLGLVLKPFPGGFHLLCSDLEHLKGETYPLIIRLMQSDPLFFNYTDFGQEFRPDLGVFYFPTASSLNSSGAIHRQEVASMKDSLQVIQRQNLNSFFESVFRDGNRLFRSSGEELFITNVDEIRLSTDEEVLLVDQSNVTTGYFLPASNMDRRPHGIIAVFLEEIYRQYSLKGDPLGYILKYGARKTIWKYVLQDRSYDKLSSLSIGNPKNQNIVFKQSEFEISPDWKVRSFESEVTLPLSFKYQQRFQLTEESDGGMSGGKVIIKSLPDANAKSLHRSPDNDHDLYSLIFI